MAYSKRYYHEHGAVFVRKNSLGDVLDRKRWVAPFRTFRHLWGRFTFKQEREAQKLARKVFERALEMIMQDMIEERTIFLLPQRETGILRVGDLNAEGVDVSRFRTSAAEDHIAVGGIIRFNKLFWRTIGSKRYHLTLLRPHKARIAELRRQGMKYP